jgi:hypothetical protein
MWNPLQRPASFFLILLFFLISCSAKDDVSAIRKLVGDCARFAEEHDVKGIIKQTTEAFYASPGRHDRQGVRKILWWAFRQYGEFKILYPEPDVELIASDSAATCRVYFMIVRNKQTYPALKELYDDPEAWLEQVGKNADLYRLDLDFSKLDGNWCVTTARLAPFKGLGFDD